MPKERTPIRQRIEKQFDIVKHQYFGLRSRTGDIAGRDDAEQPLRAELFSALQMQQHGRMLAAQHSLARHWSRDRLLSRLSENESAIRKACGELMRAMGLGHRVTPAAEWLLDNFYIIEEHIRTAKRHLPKNYSKQLPRLARGNSIGCPRVYDIALETIAHGDGRIDPEGLIGFVSAYQEIAHLQMVSYGRYRSCCA